jgi:hypothetical protein
LAGILKATSATPMAGDFSTSSIVQSHEKADVIFGRGNGASSWPGNVAFRHTVWKYREQYMNARRRHKREIGRIVMLEMRRLNGRFLIIDPKTGSYHEVSEKRAEDKACQSLREKNVKMPVGFDLNAMKNRKRWFGFIMNDPLYQDYKSNGSTARKQSKKIRVTKSTAKKCRHPSISSSVHAPNKLAGRNPSAQSGKRILFGEDSTEYNDIMHDDDMSLFSLDNMAHPSLPFHGESYLSNQSVDGYGDDNSVLVDLKRWPEREDHVT